MKIPGCDNRDARQGVSISTNRLHRQTKVTQWQQQHQGGMGIGTQVNMGDTIQDMGNTGGEQQDTLLHLF